MLKVLAVSAGCNAPVQLSPANTAWVAERRVQVQQVMGAAAGIMRNQDGLQKGLENMMHLCLEAQV